MMPIFQQTQTERNKAEYDDLRLKQLAQNDPVLYELIITARKFHNVKIADLRLKRELLLDPSSFWIILRGEKDVNSPIELIIVYRRQRGWARLVQNRIIYHLSKRFKIAEMRAWRPGIEEWNWPKKAVCVEIQPEAAPGKLRRAAGKSHSSRVR